MSEEKVAEQLKFHHTINGKLLIPKRKQHEEFCFRNRRGGRLSDGSIQPLDKGTSQFLSTRNPLFLLMKNLNISIEFEARMNQTSSSRRSRLVHGHHPTVRAIVTAVTVITKQIVMTPGKEKEVTAILLRSLCRSLQACSILEELKTLVK